MKKYRSILIFVLLLVCIFLVFYLTDSSGKGQKINTNDVSTLIETTQEGETASVVGAIYMSNGSGKILLRDSKIDAKNFPSKADYYFSYGSSEDVKGIIKAINTYNNGKALDDTTRIGYNSQVAQASFLESAMPYISIVILLVFGFFLVKTILGANNKNFSFGKTKARMAQNVKVTFADVAGVDEEKEELQEVVEFLKNPQKFTELGAKIPKGILLVGLPGTGKTLLAKAIAGESNVPFFSISGSDFVEMFVGVGASRVRDLFDQAKKNSPCIVFIDEIDAVGRQRGAGLGGGNDEREQTLNQLLVQMDGFEPNEGIIVIAATNRSDVLDPALLRPGRFDRQIHVNPPDVKGREKIIEVHSKNKPLDSSVNIKTIARLTSGFTGADIENLMNEAAIYTAKCGRKKITMTDITEGINKVLMGPQKKSRVMTESDKKITACHESGHAIVGNVLDNCDNVQEVSIIPRGAAAGYTISRPDKDDNHLTLNKLNDLIAMMLAGRVSEEIVMKDISTGAQNDIQRATQIARKMVTSWGMSKNLGTVDLSGSEEVFIGRDYQMQKPYSEDTASKVDEEIRQIIEYNYKRAKEIITSNLEKLKTMSEVLLERETIYSEEVKMIMEGKTAKTIIKKMDKEAEKTKILNKKNSAEAELETVRKEQTVRLKTAEALRSAGIISAEEFNKVREETGRLINEAEDKFDQITKEVEAKQIVKKSEVKVSEMIQKPDSQLKAPALNARPEVKKEVLKPAVKPEQKKESAVKKSSIAKKEVKTEEKSDKDGNK